MTHQNIQVPGSGCVQPRSGTSRLLRPCTAVHALCTLLIALLALTATVAADDIVGGKLLTTMHTGTVTGDLFIDAVPAPDWGSSNVVKTFTLPETSMGNITWAKLYVSAYVGHMQNDYPIYVHNRWDGDGVAGYEWEQNETGHAPFNFWFDSVNYTTLGNDNSGFPGHGTQEPYKMISDHENRVTSDYLMWYNVTDMIHNQTVFVNTQTTGSFDGRIKMITLLVAYDDPASTLQTQYWVNEGHDVCSYYTEPNFGYAAVGSTSFGTTGITGITSATLTVDYLASNNGNYGFPTAANTFVYTGGSPPVSGDFTNLPLDREADEQGPYSGVDSWDVTSSVTGSSDVALGYARYFPGSGTAAFYKIPLAFLVVKKPLPPAIPVAGFAADVVSGTAPLSVTFTDQSTNTPTSWAWDFGDGNTSAAQNPVHEYVSAGSYTVTLTATNSAGSDDEIKTGYITVNGGEPAADFTATPLAGARPLTVTFTDQSTNTPTSWVWDFGDGDSTNATQQNPVHTYAAAGTYTVTLNATNALGTGSMTKTGFITVTPQCDLTISGTIVPVPATAIFAKEPNTVKVNSVTNNGPDTVTNISLALYASDVSGGTVPVAGTVIASLASGGTTTTTLVDPTVRSAPGGSVTYTAVVDPDNLIAETNEANNDKTVTRTVYYNGYKGKRYTDGSDFTAKAMYSGRYGLVYSPGDSQYMGVTGTWTFNYTATDLPVPAGATVVDARLYQPYRYNMYPGGINWTISFNGNNITDLPDATYTDRVYYTSDYPAGLYVYNVTGLFTTSGNNSVTIGKLSTFTTSMFGPYLVVVYYDPSTNERNIWINDEADYLYSGVTLRGVSTDEATSYATFTGADTADLQSAKVIAISPLADNATAPASTFFFNSRLFPATLGSGFQSTSQIAFTEYDVTTDLATGTNTARLQSNTSGSGGGDEFIVTNAILIAEKTWTAEPVRDLIVTAVSPNAGTGDLMFANEPNTIAVTVKNNGTAAAGASTVALDDGSTVFTAPVVALDAGASATVTLTDTVLHAGGTNATLTVTADSENVIAESNEANNVVSPESTVYNNGYKGMRYTGGSDLATQVSYDGRYGIAWSRGNSAYHSSGWSEFTSSWTSSDLPVPSGATVMSARLYQPWSWNNEPVDPAFTMTFNGNTATWIANYTDRKGWGSWDVPNGVYVYDVTNGFSTTGNSITVTPETAHDYALWGAYMIVVYQDDSQPVRQIRVSDGFDNLFAGSAYSVNSSEGTAFAGFTGISTTGVTSAHATAIMAAAADTDRSRFLFNGNQYTGFWPDYQTIPQIGFSTFDVTSALAAGANEAGLQSYDAGMGGDNMYALNAILVTEASDAAPIAAFSGAPLSGDAPLTVTFTDASTGTITSWYWDFGDGDGTNATVQNPVHTYAVNGTYAVNLTVTGPGGSDSEVKPAYVTAGSGIIALPGAANLPRDLDSDGLYEDTNGNGRKDVGDVVIFYDNLNWVKTNEPLAAFDFNDNGRIDIGDVISLYNMAG